jgi:hypothetical protein
LINFETATRDALGRTHPAHIERVWDDGKQRAKSIKHEGSFIDHREAMVRAESEKVCEAIKRRIHESNWVAERNEAGQVLIYIRDQTAGKKWIEWRVVNHAKSVTYMSQTVFFMPHGLPGFLYWYLLYPFHILEFRGLIKSIAKQSES